ncbi:WRKY TRANSCRIPTION FACTOR 73 [Salix viminalis]|uniref:WRKY TRANSCRIPTION FACTOR 73 n=1 Tax=Salix viminalis TaxID=40686 RepID=A0A9Q0QIU0_SALVM|nr:WRKY TRANSCRIPTION FACTOR 73 [Salix viminalis]
MAEKQENPTTTAPAKPTITLPPRASMETLFTGGLSPGPMTLVSSFFADTPYPESDYRSFSQLLAGAMASPISRGMLKTYFETRYSSKEGKLLKSFDSES